ncbi:hypothetical protein JFT91_17275 [Pseudomonas sp. TH08]|uniref:hypothetical protein n=1 Tax=unclassified Pseudomonas TaxID=196821 RepID=UPI001913FAEC|nr:MULTISPECIES: hypothetical protein [unclassified Pseudomonas]MBK5373480.1 hypothetical protein [Pseudomonas sp. TH43]MBK5512265.1 hypothetical protein [Pseudomonas sp. TH15]MBK5534329.1 hypothetical protein [Pseudomonas sp. TH08]
MVIHFNVDGHLACGHKGQNLSASRELNRVKCRSCRNTDAYKEARKEQRNAARRVTRQAKATHHAVNWRAEWTDRLTAMAGLQRLPRGFAHQSFV